MRKVVGFIGRAGSGKDTAADIILKHQPTFENIKMAGPLKAMTEALFVSFGVSPENARHMMEDHHLKVAPIWEMGDKSPRFIMQTLGTEWGRNTVCDDLWINAFKARAEKAAGVVCTDVRFPNEAALIQQLGGFLVKIDADERLGPNNDPHPSEVEMEKIQPYLTIRNNGSVDEFLRQIENRVLPYLQEEVIE
jgi:hypothetical protein